VFIQERDELRAWEGEIKMSRVTKVNKKYVYGKERKKKKRRKRKKIGMTRKI
jgi:hypothetical protein